MQQDFHPVSPLRRPARLVKYTSTEPPRQGGRDQSAPAEQDDMRDAAVQPTKLLPLYQSPGQAAQRGRPLQPHPSLPVTPPFSFKSIPDTGDDPDLDDISIQSTARLMQLSGMVRAVRPQRPSEAGRDKQPVSQSGLEVVEEYWPNGIQQTGPLPVINLYGSEPFGRSAPYVTVPVTPPLPVESPPLWKTLLGKPAVKIALGLFIGVALLLLVAQFVNVPLTLQVLRQNLATPRGILLALLSGVAFLTAFALRGMRWRLFLNPICKLSPIRVMQIFLVGTFLNFLLPIRGGEVAKALIIKRTTNVPVSKTLPTIAMDKALDLMPALFIIALVPFLGMTLDIQIWLILILVGGLLVGMALFVGLAAWKRDIAITLLHRGIAILPRFIGSRIEGFATGFVDSLLMGASRPKIFLPAILLTAVAVFFEGLFAMLAFWTIGLHISFGLAIFGYTLYNMFYILPTPPGQVGSNEAVGLLVFAGLLGLPADKVTAMFLFSHPWAALMMTVIGMASLSALGLTISGALKGQTENAASAPRLSGEQPAPVV